MKTLKIVSRKSPLARIQAQLVAKEIRKQFPNINLEHIYKSTLGDADLTTPLNKMPDVGVFTNDIRNDLLNGEADIAVHSWKDLPVDLEKGTKISATIKRADKRDMFFIKKESLGKQKLSILSSSPRREKNLSLFLPLALPFESNISFKDVRGNIHTRLKKLIEGNDDGLVVAKAA
ncbi:MAG: hydroxymethylbilane synthase, partial [Pseudomonadota bacterium]|nr:hydroxymethylbilane synthase [Pseudomonadota bacterium]